MLELFTDFADPVAVRKILLGVKDRVEGRVEPMAVQIIEVALWAIPVLQFLAALVAIFIRDPWWKGWLIAAAAASALEERTEDLSNTAGRIQPAAELEGELLLEIGRADDALAAFESSLSAAPNRARSLYGAARSAELAGYSDSARRYYADLVELMEKADTVRPELSAARAYLTAS